MTPPATSRSSSTGSSPCWRPRCSSAGRRPGRRHPRPRRAHRGGAAALPGGARGRHRPRRARPRAQPRAARAVRRAGHPRARGLRRDRRRARRASASPRRRRALRPRRLLDAARPPRARVRLRRGRAARHADERHRRPDRGRRAQQYPVEELARILTLVRRGEVRPPDRRRRSCGSARRSRSPARRGSSSCSATRSRRPPRRTGGHPAKRTFQALRIEVNDELSVLRRALPAAIDAIGVGGRVVVMSYHSLEDRLTKQAFAEATRSTVPPDLPFVPEGHEPALRLVTRGAEKAVRRRDRRRTHGPPRCGCAPSSVSGGGRMNSARDARRANHEGTRSMSALMNQARSRVPRIAEAAVERARLTVVPRPRRGRAARVPVRDPGVAAARRRRRRAAAVQHLACSRRPSPPPRWRTGPPPSTRAAAVAADGPRAARATRSGWPQQAQAHGHGAAEQPRPSSTSPTARCSASRGRRAAAADSIRDQPAADRASRTNLAPEAGDREGQRPRAPARSIGHADGTARPTRGQHADGQVRKKRRRPRSRGAAR